jgi:hypothetical protein
MTLDCVSHSCIFFSTTKWRSTCLCAQKSRDTFTALSFIRPLANGVDALNCCTALSFIFVASTRINLMSDRQTSKTKNVTGTSREPSVTFSLVSLKNWLFIVHSNNLNFSKMSKLIMTRKIPNVAKFHRIKSQSNEQLLHLETEVLMVITRNQVRCH